MNILHKIRWTYRDIKRDLQSFKRLGLIRLAIGVSVALLLTIAFYSIVEFATTPGYFMDETADVTADGTDGTADKRSSVDWNETAQLVGNLGIVEKVKLGAKFFLGQEVVVEKKTQGIRKKFAIRKTTGGFVARTKDKIYVAKKVGGGAGVVGIYQGTITGLKGKVVDKGIGRIIKDATGYRLSWDGERSKQISVADEHQMKEYIDTQVIDQ